MNIKTPLILGTSFLFLAVAFGAFGAHGLKGIVVGKYLDTFQTGISYHYYHGFALVLLGLIKSQIPEINIKPITYCFAVGIFLFSFNCYIFAITQTKAFAMIIPIGGVLFLTGWFNITLQIYRKLK